MTDSHQQATRQATAEEVIADRLRRVHFDGEGCGTHGPNACSICHGPSPMSAADVATEAIKALRDAGLLNDTPQSPEHEPKHLWTGAQVGSRMATLCGSTSTIGTFKPDRVDCRDCAAATPMCHNGHPFEPGVSVDHAPGEADPRWCNTCGEVRRTPPAGDAMSAHQPEIARVAAALHDLSDELVERFRAGDDGGSAAYAWAYACGAIDALADRLDAVLALGDSPGPETP